MSKPFDMELFLAGILTGAHATRERHLHQAKAIQAAIANRWHRDNPWTWQRKHLDWFLNQHLIQRSDATRYYYLLTVYLLTLRLGKPWQFKVPDHTYTSKGDRQRTANRNRGENPSRAWC